LFVVDADQSEGVPVLGTIHVRAYRPPDDLAVVVFTQLAEPSAAPALAAAPRMLARIRPLIGLGDNELARVVVYYPEGTLETNATFFLVADTGPGRVGHDQVSAWEGTPIRLFSTANATIARLP
jgi:hypothetical protein